MSDCEAMIRKARAVLEHETGINLHRSPITLAFEDGIMTLEGEVENIREKKLALERIAALPGVDGIVDRLHIHPGERLGDDEIRDHFIEHLMLEQALHGQKIDVEVINGIITLNGSVPSLSHKRLAGVLAWWTRGRRDVINGLEVVPPQEDSADEIADAVRLVLEKDPYVNADRIRVGARESVVSLAGSVPTDTERDMAEFDAWYVFGVDGVINRLEVA